MTDSVSVDDIAGEIGARVDILVNTAEHVRAGGVIERHGLTVAREEMDIRYLTMRLAQAAWKPGPARPKPMASTSAAAFAEFPSYSMCADELAGLWRFLATEAAGVSAAQSLRTSCGRAASA